MKTNKAERDVIKAENVNGGIGYILKEPLITDEQKGDSCGLFARITLNKDCEVGYHIHNGETETYYILKGKGIYKDNDKEYEVSAGDVTFCKSGNGHGLVNNCDEPLEMIALILKEK